MYTDNTHIHIAQSYNTHIHIAQSYNTHIHIAQSYNTHIHIAQSYNTHIHIFVDHPNGLKYCKFALNRMATCDSLYTYR